MRIHPPLAGGLAAMAAVAAGLSLASEGGGLMTPLGAAAGACAAAAVALALAGRLAAPAPKSPTEPEREPERLRQAMDSGRLGRRSVIAQLRSLALSDAARWAALSSEEEARVLRLPQGEFLLWVEGRIDELEAAT